MMVQASVFCSVVMYLEMRIFVLRKSGFCDKVDHYQLSNRETALGSFCADRVAS